MRVVVDVQPDEHRRSGIRATRVDERAAARVQDLECSQHAPRVAHIERSGAHRVALLQLSRQLREPLRCRGEIGSGRTTLRIRCRPTEIEAVDQGGDVQPGAADHDRDHVPPLQVEERVARCIDPVGDAERCSRVGQLEQVAAHAVELGSGGRARPHVQSTPQLARVGAEQLRGPEAFGQADGK